MLSRIYIDNFRCLVNFEMRLGKLNLLLGENGSGKTTVFDVLRRLQAFLSGDCNVDAAFPAEDLTRWESRLQQTFEVCLTTDIGTYLYALDVAHTSDRRKRRVETEHLLLNGQRLYEFQAGVARLFRDDGSKGPEYPFDWSRSGVGALHPRADNTLLTRFREGIAQVVVVGFCPPTMASESTCEERSLSERSENFASWYRYLSQEHQGNILELTEQLRAAVPGFDSFSLREFGEKARSLKVLFRCGSASAKPIVHGFDELSDGQRMLVVLYSLLYGLKGLGYSLFLDEPDNYVALREIQPWLTALQDACGDGIEQAVLISHHPEVIDYLAASSGKWFSRQDNGPARVADKPAESAEGLKPSEAIARGWTR